MLSLVKRYGWPSRMLSPSISTVPSRPAVRLVAPGFKVPSFRARGGLDGQVAEVHRVPEDDAVGDAFVNIPLVVIGEPQADHLDVGAAGLLDGLGGAGDGRRADGHDELDVGIGVQDRVGLVERFFLQVVARPQRGHRDVGIFLRRRASMVFCQAIMLAAVSEAVMMANAPLPPSTRAALSIRAWPIPSGVA